MKIKQISVEAFGVWSQLNLDGLSGGLTVLAGRNEAGKSTLVQFLRGVLYGFADQRRRRYLEPVHADRAGGGLRLTTRRGDFLVSRYVKRDLEAADAPFLTSDNLVVADSRGGSVSSSALGKLLGDIDEATFNNVFAVGLREIQELGSLNDTQAAEHLYRLSGGMDRVSLFDVVKRLDTARRGLFSPDDPACRLTELMTRRRRLQQEVTQSTAHRSDWLEAAQQRAAVEAEITRFEKNALAAEKQAKVLETALQIRDSWLEQQHVEKELADLGPAPQLPEAAMQRWQRIDAAWKLRQEQLDQVQNQRSELLRQGKALPIDRRIWSASAKIEAMAEHAPCMISLGRQVQHLETQIGEIETQVHSHWEKWGQSDGAQTHQSSNQSAKQSTNQLTIQLTNHALAQSRGKHSEKSRSQTSRHKFSPTHLNPKNLAALREPGRRLRKMTRRLEQITQRQQESRHRAQQLSDEVAQALAELETAPSENQPNHPISTAAPQKSTSSHESLFKNLTASVDQRSELVSQLRRRVQLEESIEKILRQQQEMEDRQEELYARQVLPPQKLMWIGVPFVGGVMLILSGVLGGWLWQMGGDMGWALVLVGCAALAFSACWKTWLERAASRELAACQRRMNLLEVHLTETEQERDEVEARLPPGQGDTTYAERLTRAEDELEQLEHILPLDAHRQAAEQEAERADSLHHKAGRAADHARKSWQAALAAHHLPLSLNPEDLRGLSDKLREDQAGRSRLDELRQQLDQRRSEYQAHCQRVVEVAGQLGIGGDNSAPEKLLEAMTAALAKQKDLFQQRRGFRQQYRGLKKESLKRQKSLSKLTRRRRALLREADVEDESQLSILGEKATQIEQLMVRKRELHEEIENAVVDEVSPEAVMNELAGGAHASLDQRWEELAGRFDQAQNRLSELKERRGELNQKIKMLAADRRLGQARWELASLERQITQAARRWHTLALSRCLMKQVHTLYEAQRQPEALQEASHYLSALTRGKYQRVWTPFEEDVLYVDDQNGRPLSAEILSRGTREAVYLSLRLALASSYSRRGVELPLILDDVLVNLDADRVAAAAEVLNDFAHEHSVQVLLFTCHQHIRLAFTQVGADIRSLSHRGEEFFTASHQSEEVEERVEFEEEPEEEDEFDESPMEEIEEETVEEQDDLEEDLGEEVAVDEAFEEMEAIEVIEEAIEAPIKEDPSWEVSPVHSAFWQLFARVGQRVVDGQVVDGAPQSHDETPHISSSTNEDNFLGNHSTNQPLVNRPDENNAAANHSAEHPSPTLQDHIFTWDAPTRWAGQTETVQ